MLKFVGAAMLTLLGSSALVGVAYLQSHPYALCRNVPRVSRRPAAAPRPSARPLALASAGAASVPAPPAVVQLDELVVVGKAPRPVSARRRKRLAEPKLRPCSPWRALGPVYTSRSPVPRQRHVQLLCPVE